MVWLVSNSPVLGFHLYITLSMLWLFPGGDNGTQSEERKNQDPDTRSDETIFASLATREPFTNGGVSALLCEAPGDLCVLVYVDCTRAKQDQRAGSIQVLSSLQES